MPVLSVVVERLSAAAAAAAADDLAGLLVDAVEGGASVGFLPPVPLASAREWAAGVASDVADGAAVLLVARLDGEACGCVLLRPAPQANGRHRGEVAKLMVLRSARRRGIGSALMAAVEAEARAAGLRTLLLDTETGSDAERLYAGLGWIPVGTVPEYAVSPTRGLSATSFFYRLI